MPFKYYFYHLTAKRFNKSIWQLPLIINSTQYLDTLKQNLYQLCHAYIDKCIEANLQTIADAQKASNDDTKSSAGDKYETGRAMMQQEKDRGMAQLNEANKQKVFLNSIATNTCHTKAETGSLIFTDKGNFYLAISAGVLRFQGVEYVAVSPASPIGMKLKGLAEGQNFSLNGKVFQINKII